VIASLHQRSVNPWILTILRTCSHLIVVTFLRFYVAVHNVSSSSQQRGARKPVCRINSWLWENLLVGMLAKGMFAKGMLANLPQLHSSCVVRHETSFIARNACRCRGHVRNLQAEFRFQPKRCFFYNSLFLLFTNSFAIYEYISLDWKLVRVIYINPW